MTFEFFRNAASNDETIRSEIAKPPAKPVRRVLPEHEGRYKITLPSGTTERSKQILAKKAISEYNQAIFLSNAEKVTK